MSRKKRQRRPERKVPAAPAVPHQEPDRARGARRRSRGKTWWFRLLAMFGVPLVVFGGIECTLRLAGAGYDPAFLIHDEENPALLHDHPQFAWRFFPRSLARTSQPLRIAARKPQGTTRILVVGGSAAMGDPEPAYGPARVLQVLINARFPGHRFEVVNAAVTAINSHVVLPIVRDCTVLAPDAVIVYMGNNEVHGPFGSGTVFGEQAPPLWSIRAGLALKKTKTGQVLASLGGTGGVPESWGGLEMFLEQRIASDDPKLQRVYHNFDANLRAIIDATTACGAKAIVSTVAVNLKDSPPFFSLPETVTPEWQRLVKTAAASQAAGNLAPAVREFEAALRLTPQHAELHFRHATCLLATGRNAEALAAFARARDHDALRFRADSHLNGIIRSVTAELADDNGAGDIFLLDAERAFAAASPEGIPGENLLWEHVHLNFDGSYLLGRLLAQTVATALALPVSEGADGEPAWLDREACMRELGLTLLQRRDVARFMLERTAEPPFSLQLGHDARQQRLRQLADVLEQQMFQQPLAEAMDNYLRILSARPDDWMLHREFAAFLTAGGDLDGAITQRRAVTRLLPHHPEAFRQLGNLLHYAKRWDEAIPVLERATALDPSNPIAREQLHQALQATRSGR